MIELILDTNILADFLEQYFNSTRGNRGYGKFLVADNITREIAQKINSIVGLYTIEPDPTISGLIISSTLAFVELVRHFDTISRGRFSIDNLYDFIQTHPGWFSIAPVDMDLIPFFLEVPKHVQIEEREFPIEWTDAVHVATVFSRGDHSYIVATDSRISVIPGLKGRFLK